jgi:hypothetical protein
MATTQTKLLAHFLGIVAFTAAGVAAALLYMLIVGKVLGQASQGFGVAASIVTFPFVACVFAVLVWLPLWILHGRRAGSMSPRAGLLWGAAFGTILAFIFAGPSGFAMRGGAPLINYFLIAMLALGGFIYNATARWALARWK